MPLSSYFLWGVVAAVGAAIVLSYAILAEYFTKDLAGRANGALNLFHIAAAFVGQYATGLSACSTGRLKRATIRKSLIRPRLLSISFFRS